jgi:integrase
MATADGKIGLREVRALAPQTELFDGPGGTHGFGARRRAGDAVSYFIMFRTAAGLQRRFTIGAHGAPWTPETARKRAKEILADVTKGADPSADKRAMRDAITMDELCESYMEAARAGRVLKRKQGTPKKASTLDTDQSRINSHILPLLGKKKAAAITSADIETFMLNVAAGKTHRREKMERARAFRVVRGGMGTASRTVGLLGAIFAWAVKQGLRDDNPVRGVDRPADGKRDRRLTEAEYAALNTALDAALSASGDDDDETRRAMWPHAVAAIRFLALTGWRSGEAIALRWRDVALAQRTANLPDSKTGKSMRALSLVACAVLEAQHKLTGGAADGLVFPPARGGEGATMTGLKRAMGKVVKLAGMGPDVTAHVLRHSFSSVAADMQFSDLTIGTLIGHKKRGITNRYSHVADAVLLGAADRIAGEIARQMGARPVASVSVLRQARAARGIV